MEVNLVVGFLHVPVPSRVKSLKKAISRLGDLPYLVVEDPTMQGPWGPCSTALSALSKTDATHIIILPDDCLPCFHFADHAERAISAAPEEVVSLYTNTPRAGLALSGGMSWVSRINGLVQFCAPKSIVPDFLSFVDNYVPPWMINKYGEDTMMDLYLMANRKLSWTSAVSLLDHPNNVSLQNHEDHDFRRPAIGPYEDMSTVNWNTNALYVGAQKELHWGLMELTPDGREKYKVHEIVYEYAAHRHADPRTSGANARVRSG